MDLIRDIRKGYADGIDVENPRSSSIIHNLLENALDSLSDDIYTKATHFILEFIQNADDNTYHEDVKPTLVMELQDRRLKIRCNETGFREADVRALCSLGNSTKNDRSGYIGEKGIGFKSAFLIADTVHVVSGQYSFMFDKRSALGKIMPTWSDEVIAPEGWTLFQLGLSPQTQHNELALCLQDVRPSYLLFLRRIHCMRVITENKALTIEKTALPNGAIRVQRFGDGPTRSDDYFIFKHTVKTAGCEEKRTGISSSEILLGFPVTEDEHPVIEDQAVHAFLPLRSVGFPFIVHADFLTSSNREDILADKGWNRVLRDAIPVAFVQAIPALQQRPTLAYAWIRYIPHHIVDDFLKPVHSSLISQLQQLLIIMCQDGVLRQPSKVLMLPSAYRSGGSEIPLIPSKHVIPKYYLSAKYDPVVDRPILEMLGAEQMTETHFLYGLSLMDEDKSLFAQSETWWEEVCCILCRILCKHRDSISGLKLVPLADGTWDRVSEDIHFDPALASIPMDVGLRLVRRLDPSSSHFRLLQDLGLREINVDMVVERIKAKHTHGGPELHRATLPSHAHFIFKHQANITLQGFSALQVVTRDNKILPSSQVYMDHPKHAVLPLSNYLKPPDARFLHEAYDSPPWTASDLDSRLREWKDWLHHRLLVNIAPRLMNTGLSAELRTFLKSADTPTKLAFLREYGADLKESCQNYPDARKELRGTMVATSNGNKRLETTYIARYSLTRIANLPFLPLENPDDDCWDFLSAFGVTIEADGGFYLRQLINLSERLLVPTNNQDDPTYTAAKELYKQLEARFYDGDYTTTIRNAFKEHHLIYLPAQSFSPPLERGRWFSSADVVWEGPPSMCSKHALATTYSALQTFFREQLKISNCPSDILVQELKSVHARYGNYPLDDSALVRVHNILSDMHGVLEKIHPSQTTNINATVPWIHDLRRMRFVPVVDGQGITRLRSIQHNFYIPDVDEYLSALFKDDVPMLSLPPQKSRADVMRLRGLFTRLSDLFNAVTRRYSQRTKFKFLDDEVKKELANDNSMRIPNPILSERYRLKVPYILRTVNDLELANSIPRSLCGINVYDIESDKVNHTYTLDRYFHVVPLFLGIDITESHCIVLIGRSCSEEKRDSFLCRELAHHIPGLGISDLYTVLTQPLVVIDELFPVNDASSSMENLWSEAPPADWFSISTTGPTDHFQIASTSNGASTSGQSPPTQSALPLSVGLDRRTVSPEEIQRFCRLAAATAQQYMNFVSQRAEARLQAETTTGASGVSGNDSDSISSVSTRTPDSALSPFSNSDTEFFAPSGSMSSATALPLYVVPQLQSQEPSAEQNLIGISGEIYVFTFLQKLLPGFTHLNWTSELRRCIGHPAFTGEAKADFTYKDECGVLTEWLFQSAEWTEHLRGRWPTYHLEVKASCGPATTPFHMSALQLDYAHQTASWYDDWPENVYVIVRVSSLCRGVGEQYIPNIKMCPYPLDMLYCRDIKIESSVEIAISETLVDRLGQFP